jgi:hypothetical protein
MNRYRERVLSGLRIAGGDVLRQVRDPARLKDPGLVTGPDLQRALQDIADLDFAAMDVESVPSLRVEVRFEEVIRTAGLLTCQLVRDGEEIQHLA